jgi:hypothetical protein
MGDRISLFYNLSTERGLRVSEHGKRPISQYCQSCSPKRWLENHPRSIPTALWCCRCLHRFSRGRNDYAPRTLRIAAEKAGRKIAVEVKSFVGGSTISEFHTAVGQFINYRIALEVSNEPERILYLAFPIDTYQMFLKFEPAKTVIERYQVRLIIYNPNQEVIDRWIE